MRHYRQGSGPERNTHARQALDHVVDLPPDVLCPLVALLLALAHLAHGAADLVKLLLDVGLLRVEALREGVGRLLQRAQERGRLVVLGFERALRRFEVGLGRRLEVRDEEFLQAGCTWRQYGGTHGLSTLCCAALPGDKG